MLPNCREVAEQLSENIDKPLTGMRWLKLKLHLLMCSYCRRYSKQIDLSAKTVKLNEKSIKPNEVLKQKLLQEYRECYGDKKHSGDESQD